MTTEVSHDLRCYWCNRLGGEIVKNDMEEIVNNKKWKQYVFQTVNPETNQLRDKLDIMTDYDPNIIGCPRPWMECHYWKS